MIESVTRTQTDTTPIYNTHGELGQLVDTTQPSPPLPQHLPCRQLAGPPHKASQPAPTFPQTKTHTHTTIHSHDLHAHLSLHLFSILAFFFIASTRSFPRLFASHLPMARWLIEAATLPSTGSNFTSYLMGIGGLLLSLCGAILILSMCSLCYTRRQVRDKPASSSDGDVSPAKQAVASSRKNSAYSLNNVSTQEKEDQTCSTEPEQQAKSPNVWQRTILMGERCQRPTFSGLILYDEKGNPLPRCLSVLGQAKM